MENIYDIRAKNGLLYILPEEAAEKNDRSGAVLEKCVIVVNLYYDEMLEMSCEYISRIPEEIRVLCISSRQRVLDQAEKWICRENVAYILKENRGRDVSALLVTARETVKKYKYFCWLHDKNHKFEGEQDEVQTWSKGLWDNSILSGDYIRGVIHIFEENETVGMLLPPEPTGDYSYAWYGDAWTNEKNYIRTKELIERYHLKAVIDRDTPPLLGTTMWARTDSVKKLLETEWRYEDFPEEPMPHDGTLSHALERCYPYFAQDAGYVVGTVMCSRYAAQQLLWAQENMRYLFKAAADEYAVNSLHQLKTAKKQAELLQTIFAGQENVLFFGTGVYAGNMLKTAEKMGYAPDGFVVSDGRKEHEMFHGYPVYELHEITPGECLIVIAASYSVQEEIAGMLEARGLDHYIKGVL